MPQVIIIGAGPAGLSLGAEIAAQGISCRIYEQRANRSIHSRAFSLFPHTLELLNMRGIVENMISEGVPISISPIGDGKNRLDLKNIASNFPYILSIQQNKTEEILEQWALSCGCEIVREARVISLSQDANTATVKILKNGDTFFDQAEYIIGCDGAYGSTRDMLGITFEGIKYDQSLMHGDVHLKYPFNPSTYARTNRYGTVAIFPFKNNTYRLLLLDYTQMKVPTEQAVTLEEFQQSAARLLDQNIGIHDPIWMSRFSCQQRHAQQYRQNRVLLAGDAAHALLPAGGQGLQVSIQDAFNLGWKLVSEIKGVAPKGLLDSYEAERRKITSIAMMKSAVLFEYEVSPSFFANIARWLINKLIMWLPVKTLIMNEVLGLRTHYRLPQHKYKHKLIGHRAHNINVIDNNKNQNQLHNLLRARKFVFIDQTNDLQFSDQLKQKYGATNIVVAHHADSSNNTSLLIRPDGFIAWASDKKPRLQDLSDELQQWILPV